ncbi:MAG: Rieske (2Fe-2S) protein [Nitrospirae bacterium]|nr:Rieske (2Fe-2S) protein [Nitrospirota bacterium]
MAEFIRIADIADIKPGSGTTVEVGGKSLAVFNVEGSYYVIDNDCVHRGGPLGAGELEGNNVSCPWHGWSYDVKTGKCINNPSACVKSYPVTIDGADINIRF